MCGIVGYVGPARPEVLRHAMRVMQHRGPDSSGVFDEHDVHLGHLRLSIVDLSEAGAQPMISRDGRWAIVYNGEVYNAAELRAALPDHGRGLRGHSDTEVMLETIAARGIRAVTDFNGMFAFAAYDRRERVLWLVRDHFGIKPLYYTVAAGGLRFASELKGLLAFPEVEGRLSLSAVEQFLLFLWVPQPETIYGDVRQLPPGHMLRCDTRTGRIDVRRWFDLPAESPSPDEAPDFADAVAETRELFERAVTRQLTADVPVGAFLSGGLDSSAIAAVVRRHTGQPFDCHTVAFDESSARLDNFVDDLPFARETAQYLDVNLHVHRIAPDLVNDLPAAVYYLDEPVADPAALNTYLISRAARDRGNVVLLSGQGADELFGGYRRYIAQMGIRRVERMPRWMRSAARAAVGALVPRVVSGSLSAFVRRVHKMFDVIDLPWEERAVSLFHWSPPPLIRSLFAPEFHAELAARDPDRVQRALLGEVADCSDLQQLQYLDLRTFMPSLNLTYGDRMTMRASVEMRVPFLDLDLVRYVWSLPDDMKVRGSNSKRLLREVVRPWLPRSVLTRPKTGFGAPVRDWIAGGLRELLADVLSFDSVKARGIFDPTAVENLIREHVALEADHGYLLYALLTFELWSRTYIDARSRGREPGPLSLTFPNVAPADAAAFSATEAM